jgi:hypothetical protein
MHTAINASSAKLLVPAFYELPASSSAERIVIEVTVGFAGRPLLVNRSASG